MKALLALLALASFQNPITDVSTVPANSYSPISVTMRQEPGYFQGVSIGMPENGVIEIQVEALDQTPTKKWQATAYIALMSDKESLRYYLNLSTDSSLQKQYVRARIVDKDSGEELSSHRHQDLFELNSIVMLKIVIDGKTANSYVNGTLIETQELPFNPEYYDLGVSSGSYKMTVLRDKPPPAPPSNDAG